MNEIKTHIWTQTSEEVIGPGAKTLAFKRSTLAIDASPEEFDHETDEGWQEELKTTGQTPDWTWMDSVLSDVRTPDDARIITTVSRAMWCIMIIRDVTWMEPNDR